MCAHHWAQPSYTTQHRRVLKIFHLNLYTCIIALMQSIGWGIIMMWCGHDNSALQPAVERHLVDVMTAFRRHLKSELFLRCFGQDCVWRIFACARLRMHAFIRTFVKCSCSPLDFTTLLSYSLHNNNNNNTPQSFHYFTKFNFSFYVN